MSDVDDIESMRQALSWIAGPDMPERFRLCGSEWILCDGVFPATVTGGTEVFAALLRPYFAGRFCEVGCGTGVISVLAARSGAESVLALDVNRAAAHNTRLNAAKQGVGDRVTAVVSDLFEAVDPDDSFDCVFWNAPWNLADLDVELRSDLERAVCDPGYLLHQRYVEQSPRRLRPEGTALLGTTDVGDLTLLHELAAGTGRSLRVVATERRAEVHRLMTYYLLEIRDPTPDGW